MKIIYKINIDNDTKNKIQQNLDAGFTVEEIVNDANLIITI